jgi:hypothetical protein
MGTTLLVAGSVWVGLSAVFIVSLALAARGGIENREPFIFTFKADNRDNELMADNMARQSRARR